MRRLEHGAAVARQPAEWRLWRLRGLLITNGLCIRNAEEQKRAAASLCVCQEAVEYSLGGFQCSCKVLVALLSQKDFVSVFRASFGSILHSSGPK